MLKNIIAKESTFNKSSPITRWPRRRALVVLVGLPTVRFDFFSVLYSRIEAKKYPVGFPTRHQRRSSQQIRQAAFSFGDICCSAILFYGFHQELWVTEILLHKIIRLHIMHPKICFTKFAWFFSRTLKLKEENKETLICEMRNTDRCLLFMEFCTRCGLTGKKKHDNLFT